MRGAFFGWLAEFMRRPPRNDRGRGMPFMVIGHRGAPCAAVENTLDSFRKALDIGANGLEMDVCLTQDRRVAIWHDWDPCGRVCRIRERGLEPGVLYRPLLPDESQRRSVHLIEYDELTATYGYALKSDSHKIVRGVIPTLDDVVGTVCGDRRLQVLFLDIKLPEEEVALVPDLIRAIDKALEGCPPDLLVILETACLGVLRAMMQVAPYHNYTFDSEPVPGIAISTTKWSAVLKAIDLGISFATPQMPRILTFAPWVTHRRIVRHEMERFRKYNREHPDHPLRGVIPFTLNDESKMEWLLRLGVHGIQTDRPDLLRGVAEGLGRTFVLDGSDRPGKVHARNGVERKLVEARIEK